MEEAKEVIGSIQDKNSISDFSFSEIFGLYKKTKGVAKDLNLDFGFSIANKSFTLKDKKNNNVLIEGNISDLENYYDKYVEILQDKESHLETNISKQNNNEKENITKVEDIITPKTSEENKNSYNNISKKEINTNKNNALENKDKNISIASRKTISPKIPLVIAGIFTIGALGVLKVLKKV